MNDGKFAMFERLGHQHTRSTPCPQCGSAATYRLTEQEIARREDTLPGLRYVACNGCGHTWRTKRQK